MRRIIPVDDIAMDYSSGNTLQKEAVSAILRDVNFLLQTSQRTIMQKLTLEDVGDLIITMFLQLEEEFGKVFTSSMASALLARFDTATIEKLAHRAMINKNKKEDCNESV